MIIADLTLVDDDKVAPTRVYLAAAPFPGDIILVAHSVRVMVIRRTFLDLGPDTGDAAERLSITLEVRPLQ